MNKEEYVGRHRLYSGYDQVWIGCVHCAARLTDDDRPATVALLAKAAA